MKVQDYMTREVVVAHPHTTAKELAELLSSHTFGAVPVVDGEGVVIGVVSDSDLVSQDIKIEFPTYFKFVDGYVMAPGRLREFEEQLERATKKTAQGLMSEPPLVIEPTADLRDAATVMMQNHVDQLPVVEEGKLVGIISKGDIVRWMASVAADEPAEGDDN